MDVERRREGCTAANASQGDFPCERSSASPVAKQGVAAKPREKMGVSAVCVCVCVRHLNVALILQTSVVRECVCRAWCSAW